MAKKETKETTSDDKSYRAVLTVGETQLATITIRATDDEDAKEQLGRSKPTYFDGVGEWKLTKTATEEVALD